MHRKSCKKCGNPKLLKNGNGFVCPICEQKKIDSDANAWIKNRMVIFKKLLVQKDEMLGALEFDELSQEFRALFGKSLLETLTK